MSPNKLSRSINAALVSELDFAMVVQKPGGERSQRGGGTDRWISGNYSTYENDRHHSGDGGSFWKVIE